MRDDSTKQKWRLARSPLTREVLLVATVVLTLEFVVFRGYFTGAEIPQFDFMGGYNLEAYAWWRDGSFFDPPQWMRYMYGGYPAVSNFQNSSYYLPVGLSSAITSYTLHAAAVQSALHVAFGVVGTHLFLRRWGASIGPALVGATAWFFAPGFFANATHVDMMRMYAWLPWIMLVSSTKWPWHRPWAPLVATLILWQSILASYPGQLVSLGYLLPLWVIANQQMARAAIRRYVAPLAICGTAAVMMTMLRFLPALHTRGTYPWPPQDSSQFTFGMLGTFLYSELNPRIPWFHEMSSYFIPATILALLAFTPLRNRLVQVMLAIAVVALLLGLPIWPWRDLLSRVAPGMGYSRFRMTDFKVLTIFCLVVVAVFALQELVRHKPADDAMDRPRRAEELKRWIPGLLLICLCSLFAYLGAHYGYDPAPSRKQWALLVGSSVALVVLSRQRRRIHPTVAIACVVVLVSMSGIVQANATKLLWTSDRARSEQQSFGGSVDSFIAQREDSPREQRPARIPPPDDYTGIDAIDSHYGVVFYTGESSVLGYINLRGTETFQLVRQQMDIPGATGADARAFWSAAGMVIEGAADTIPAPASVVDCSTRGACGAHLVVEPVSYGTDGDFLYSLNASASIPVMLNEAHYDGWQAWLCEADAPDVCHTVATQRGTSGQITLDVPEGQWLLRLDYQLPGQSLAWVLFTIGVVASASTAAFIGFSRRRQQ